MKLRIRSSETNQTIKLSLPSNPLNPPTLQTLKHSISLHTPIPHPNTISLSLNSKHKIDDSNPNAPLISLGITPGDLIYYSTNSNKFITNIVQPIGTTKIMNNNNNNNCEKTDLPLVEKYELPETSSASLGEKSRDLEMEDVESAVVSKDVASLRESVSTFVRRVLREEGDGKDDGKLLIVAVHAVFLESGFLLESKSGNETGGGFRMKEGWAEKGSSSVSMGYTMPKVDGEVVCVNFQSIGKYVNVRGWLKSEGGNLHSLRLKKSALMRNGDEKEVFEFWKEVKDGMVLPLLMDVCEKAGSRWMPPCFGVLPVEMKMRIMELLPGVDLAKFGCVSKELKGLSSNAELWKRLFEKEFASEVVMYVEGWKKRYAVLINRKKLRENEEKERDILRRRPNPFAFGIRGERRGRVPPGPFGYGGILGKDEGSPYGSLILPSRGRRTFSPYCILGEE